MATGDAIHVLAAGVMMAWYGARTPKNASWQALDLESVISSPFIFDHPTAKQQVARELKDNVQLFETQSKSNQSEFDVD